MPKRSKTALDIWDLNLAELLARLYENARDSLVAQEYEKPSYALTAIEAEHRLRESTHIGFIHEVCISIDFDRTPIDSSAYDTLYASYAKSAADIISELRAEMQTVNRESETPSDGGDTIVIYSSSSDTEEDEDCKTPPAESPQRNTHTNSFREESSPTVKEPSLAKVDTHADFYKNTTTPGQIEKPTAGQIEKPTAVTTASPKTEERKEPTQEEEAHSKKCCDKFSNCFSGLANSLSSLFAKKKLSREAAYQKNHLDEHASIPANTMK